MDSVFIKKIQNVALSLSHTRDVLPLVITQLFDFSVDLIYNYISLACKHLWLL